ncbi:MAG: DUF456 family protein [Desulfosarcina sp.]|nr:DUF456 family protein [Desulfobacterales bacterium]
MSLAVTSSVEWIVESTMAAEIALWIIAFVFVVVGMAGLVFPILPGSPLLFAGLFMAAWAEDFAHVGTGTLVLLGGMALLTYGVDFAASAFGAKRFGASHRAGFCSTLGVVVGLFFGLGGVIIGPFAGAVIGELSVRRDLQAAGRAGIGATIGLALGAAAKLALAFAMLGVFLMVRFL